MLCRISVVVVQQSAKPIATLDLACDTAHIVVGIDQLVVQRLMVPLAMIVFQIDCPFFQDLANPREIACFLV